MAKKGSQRDSGFTPSSYSADRAKLANSALSSVGTTMSKHHCAPLSLCPILITCASKLAICSLIMRI